MTKSQQVVNQRTPEKEALVEMLKVVRDMPVAGKKYGALEHYCTAVLNDHIKQRAEVAAYEAGFLAG